MHLVEPARNPEIHELRAKPLGALMRVRNQDVRWLEIPMGDSGLVRERERREKLLGELADLRDREVPLFALTLRDLERQRDAIDALEHDVREIDAIDLQLAEIVEPHDSRMREREQHARLAQELRDVELVFPRVRHLTAHALDGDALVEQRMRAFVHDAEAALPEHASDLVLAVEELPGEGGTRRLRHARNGQHRGRRRRPRGIDERRLHPRLRPLLHRERLLDAGLRERRGVDDRARAAREIGRQRLGGGGHRRRDLDRVRLDHVRLDEIRRGRVALVRAHVDVARFDEQLRELDLFVRAERPLRALVQELA